MAGGDEVTVLTPHGPEVRDRWLDDGVEVESFRYAPAAGEVVGYSRSLSSDERLRAASGLAAPLYLLAARRAVRRRLAADRFDLVHAHWVVPNGLAAAGGLGVPLAVGLHGSDVFLAERPVVRRWVGRALSGARLLTGCSPELVDRVCALGFDRRRARVIPYGVDVEQFAADPGRRGQWRRRLGISDEATVALSVGRMVTKKGFHVLVEALPALLESRPRLHLVLGGGGDRLDELRAATAGWSGRVHYPGVVGRDVLPDLYRAADLFVLPAVHDAKGNVDGLPNVILEAMASSLPVVASGISGIPLAVRDGVEGRLVPEGDVQALAAAVAELADSAELRAAWGSAARRRVEEELTWQAVAARYRQAYEEALAGWPQLDEAADGAMAAGTGSAGMRG